ncbi:hypothetical protein GQX73_g5908 [Xylaria multiplex]|uniref:Clr5 domain-containing protein n=1 Tax=Xylaria multiplex TaxID=323545 RepID=A0A7C8MRG9_9PEZI|nr:hypothetical protein GQX73_g5908 [Xylaria multiplex]
MAALPPPSRITEEEWDHYKEIIISLFLGTGYDEGQYHEEGDSQASGQTLDELAASMRLVHGFTASVSQFEVRLKMWGARKNLTPREWKSVFERLNRLPQTTKSRVVISGRVIHKNKVSRARRRYFNKKSQAFAETSAFDPSTVSTLAEQVHIEIQEVDGRWVQLLEMPTTPVLGTCRPLVTDTLVEAQTSRGLVARNDATQGNAAAHMPTIRRHNSMSHLVSEVPIETGLSSNRAVNAILDLDIGLDQDMPLEQASEIITTAPRGNSPAFVSFMEISDPSCSVNFSLSPQGANNIDWNPPLAFDDEPSPVNPFSPSPTLREFVGPHWAENYQSLSPRVTHVSFGTEMERIQFYYSSTIASANWLHTLPTCPRIRQRHQWVPPSATIVAKLVKDIINNVYHTSTDKTVPNIFNLVNCLLDEINASHPATTIRTANLQRSSVTFISILDNILSPECFFGEEFSKPPKNASTEFTVETRLYSRLLTSFANGFAGLRNIPVAGVLRFLSRHPTMQVSMIRFLSSNSEPVSKSLAENIFQAALEDDNVDIIKYLLDHSKLVHANNNVCHHRGWRCTPLEKAIQAKSFRAVKLLIGQMVDVNKSLQERFYGRPLHGLIHDIDRKATLDDRFLGFFDAFLLAGARIEANDIVWALEYSDPRIVIRLIEKYAPESPQELLSIGHILEDIITCLKETDATRAILLIIENCERLGVDWRLAKYSQHVNNALYKAASRGYKELVEALGDEETKLFVSLIVAIKSGDQTCLLALEERDILQRLEPRQLSDALTIALGEGNQQFAARILGVYLDISTKIDGVDDSFDVVTVFAAALANDFHDIAWMILAAAPFSYRDDGWGLFTVALKERKAGFARAIIEFGAVSLPERREEEEEDLVMEKFIEWGDYSIISDLWQVGLHIRYTPAGLLTQVAKEGQMSLFWTILESCWDDEVWSIAGQVAIECENLPLLDQLIARGTRADDEKILQYAVLERPSMVGPLLERYRNVYPQGRTGYGLTAINLAIDEYPKSSKLLDTFFSSGLLRGEILKGMGTRESPLCRAIGYDKHAYREKHPRKDLIERLLDASSDVNLLLKRVDHYLAIKTGNLEVVQLLIQKGAEVNMPVGRGIRRTPLQQAAEENNVEIVRLLLENKADVSAPPLKLEGATALQFAAIHGNCHMAMMLMGHGARLDVPPPIGPHGRWPLEGAAEHGRIDMIQLLWNINNGPFDDKQCQRAMRLAEYNGHFGCRDMINQLLGRPSIQDEM